MNQGGIVLVTGAEGQLGKDMMAVLRRYGVPARGYGRQELDVTDTEEVLRIFLRDRPFAVIHAAAFTKVDEAEQNPDLAYQVNAFGSRNVAAAASQVGAKLIYVSTDYVFDGRASKPYNETARTRPINVYGASKREGERFVQLLQPSSFIVRTSWVYGPHGNNFVKTMLRQAAVQPELKVVHDQSGCPTYTLDLAEMILRLLRTNRFGTYHVTNAGICSWHEFALAIMDEAGLSVKVRSVPTSQFPRPARRPSFSALEGWALRLNGFPPMRPWREALADYLRRYAANGPLRKK